MLSYRKLPETTERKIIEYKKIARFYERNPKGRFQDKMNLIRISEEIQLELTKDQKRKNLDKLVSLYCRISKFI